MSWCNQCDGGNGHTANCPTLGLRFEEPKPAPPEVPAPDEPGPIRSATEVLTDPPKLYPEPSCDSPELAAIRARVTSIRCGDDAETLLRMVDELNGRLAIANRCIVWDAEYPREAELLTECRRQEERAEKAEAALSDKAHVLNGFAQLKDRVKTLETDLETANHWRHKANEALDGQANRANKIEKERDDLRAKLLKWQNDGLELDQKNRELEAKLAEAEKEADRWNGECAAQRERAEAAEARVQLLEADQACLVERIRALEKANPFPTITIDELEGR